MTEPPSTGPADDDRAAHATAAAASTSAPASARASVSTPAHPPAPAPSRHEPEPPFQGPLHALSKAAWETVLLTGLSSLILGILVLMWPGASLLAAGVLFGVYLLVSGVFQLVSAFGTHKTTSLRVLAFISGAVSILLGLFCFRGPLESILLLALWIGIGWLIRGITQTIAAVHDPAMPARGWMVFLGVVTFIAGVVLIVSPFESVGVLTLVAGIWLVVVGLVEIISSFGIRSRAKHIPQTL